MGSPHPPRRLLLRRRLLRFAYGQLYTNFAFAYDAVASAVSLGEWQAWGRAAMRFIGEPVQTSKVLETFEVLELAHGPGHLQVALRQAGYAALGVDLSPQMGALARRRLARARLPAALARASVETLPFPDRSFCACVSTFPTEFIYSIGVLREAWRVLAEGGRLVVIPAAPLRLRTVAERALLLAYLATRQAGAAGPDLPGPDVAGLFARAGFAFGEHRVPTQHAEVIVWVGTREADGR